VLNGVSSEGASVIVEAIFTLGTGLAVAFYFCWQVSVVALVLIPLMALGGAL
jgi:ABC-type multidrug transport system fused ATPase/permease subunit